MVKERLEDVVRQDDLGDDLMLLLRGGVYEDDVARIQQQAHDLDRRFTWRGGPCYGVSVFAATPETEDQVLAQHMDARRRYYRILYRDIAQLLLLPTFRKPHWTVMFDGPGGPQYQLFVDSYGELRDNPHWTRKPGRRPR
ncbi:MAG: hypothetical protein ACYDDU_21065 [Dermatophilaceae bacterium]